MTLLEGTLEENTEEGMLTTLETGGLKMLGKEEGMLRLLEMETVKVEDIRGADDTPGAEVITAGMEGVDSDGRIDTIEDRTDRKLDVGRAVEIIELDTLIILTEDTALDGTMLDVGRAVETTLETLTMLVVWMVSVLEEIIEMTGVEPKEEDADVGTLKEVLGGVEDCVKLEVLDTLVVETSVV